MGDGERGLTRATVPMCPECGLELYGRAISAQWCSECMSHVDVAWGHYADVKCAMCACALGSAAVCGACYHRDVTTTAMRRRIEKQREGKQ